MKFKLLIFFGFLCEQAGAQIGFGTNNPNSSAVIQMESSHRGFLMPQISLRDSKDSVQVNRPANGLTIFNNFKGGSFPNEVSTGFYSYKTLNQSWQRLWEATGTGWSVQGSSGKSLTDTAFVGTIKGNPLFFKRNGIVSAVMDVDRLATGFGVGALSAQLADAGCVAIGFYSANANTYGGYITSLGSKALIDNTTGDRETALGRSALVRNRTGSQDTAIGAETLFQHDGQYCNVAVGSYAIWNGTISEHNNAIGSEALRGNTTGGYNIGFGKDALLSTTSGRFNIAVGNRSFVNNLDGEHIVAIGFEALATSKNYSALNVAVGAQSMLKHEVGDFNTAIGVKSISQHVNGWDNSALGYNAGSNLKNGGRNLVIGAETHLAGDDIGDSMNIANGIFGRLLLGKLRSPAGLTGIGTNNPNSTLQVEGSISLNIRNLPNAELIKENDFTIILEGDAQLPEAGDNNRGRVYRLVIANAGSHRISIANSGRFMENGEYFSTYIMETTPKKAGLMVQSIGSAWLIISKS